MWVLLYYFTATEHESRGNTQAVIQACVSVLSTNRRSCAQAAVFTDYRREMVCHPSPMHFIFHRSLVFNNVRLPVVFNNVRLPWAPPPTRLPLFIMHGASFPPALPDLRVTPTAASAINRWHEQPAPVSHQAASRPEPPQRDRQSCPRMLVKNTHTHRLLIRSSETRYDRHVVLFRWDASTVLLWSVNYSGSASPLNSDKRQEQGARQEMKYFYSAIHHRVRIQIVFTARTVGAYSEFVGGRFNGWCNKEF